MLSILIPVSMKRPFRSVVPCHTKRLLGHHPHATSWYDAWPTCWWIPLALPRNAPLNSWKGVGHCDHWPPCVNPVETVKKFEKLDCINNICLVKIHTWLTCFSRFRANSMAARGDAHSCWAGRLMAVNTTLPPRTFWYFISFWACSFSSSADSLKNLAKPLRATSSRS